MRRSTVGMQKSCHEREARMVSARYFLKALLSSSLSFVANSCAASGGQPWAGKKTWVKKSNDSRPLAFETTDKKLQIS